jgi:hypothetical protein
LTMCSLFVGKKVKKFKSIILVYNLKFKKILSLKLWTCEKIRNYLARLQRCPTL